jgi:regulator of replication initiation timing
MTTLEKIKFHLDELMSLKKDIKLSEDKPKVEVEDVKVEEEKQAEEAQKEQKFAETKLEDGTVIYTDGNFEVGSEVYTLDEQGNKVPVFDAEHKLEDGSVVATVGGKITEIKPIEMAQEVAPTEVISEDVTEDPNEDVAEAGLEDRVSNIEENIALILEKLKEVMGANIEMSEEVQKFSKAPAQTETKREVKDLSDSEIRTQRFIALAESLKDKN